MRAVNKIVIHCSATREGVNVSATTIDGWHRKRGFDQIGYHYVIGLDGAIQAGRPVNVMGAHVGGGGNRASIGIAYIGGVDANLKAKDTRTEAQKAALIKIIKILKNIYPEASIHGHRDYSKDKDGDGVEAHEFMKMCPCFNAEVEYLEFQPKSFKAKSKKARDLKKDKK
jgi:N-acetyl-anhydromuramyl-L-alanine amidase AmpD